MPAVNIFLAHDRFKSDEELWQFALATNGEPTRFMNEVGLVDAEPARIELVHQTEVNTIYNLLANTPDFAHWGRKVQYSEGLYNSAILVYEPNLMRTPEACSLYYMGRLVYEDRR